MNKSKLTSIAILFASVFSINAAQAHFQMIIPSDDMVKQDESRTLNLDIMFWHPLEGHGMPMAKPQIEWVLAGEQKLNR